MKKVLIISNRSDGFLNHRDMLIEALIPMYELVLVAPYDNTTKLFEKKGFKTIDVPVKRRSKNPFSDVLLLRRYRKILQKEKPNVVLTYTIKPNIYGGFAAKRLKIPYIANITGLGVAVENSGLLQRITVFLYKKAFKKISHVFFQNAENRDFFSNHKINARQNTLLPGSGINLDKFPLSKYRNEEVIKFIFISRLMKEKGIDLYLETARMIKNKYPHTEFHIAGAMEDNYEEITHKFQNDGIIKYHGDVKNLPILLREMHCTVHPTYYPEGMSNVLLESAAMGKPIITTNRSGCKETVDDGITGYIVETRNQQQLNEAVEKFVNLSFAEKEEMGKQGRKKVENEFDRQIVVNEYLKRIKKTINKEN